MRSPSAASSAADQARVLICHQCGSPLQLQLGVEQLQCAHCGAQRPLEQGERDQLQAAVAERRKTDGISNATDALRGRLLRPALIALVTGPSSETVSLLFWVLMGPLFGFIVGELIGRPPVYHRENAILLPILILWLPIGMLCFAWYGIARAVHLKAVRASAAAVPAAQPGQPMRCRLCGAPLGAEAREAFVRCAYCSAQNLLAPAAVRQREALTRHHKHQELESLGRAELRIQSSRFRLVLSLGLLPVLIGLGLQPLYDALLVRVAPLLPAPAEPGPWLAEPAKLALLVPANSAEPWPIVEVQSRSPGPVVTIAHDGQEPQRVRAERLRILPLRSGLRLVDDRGTHGIIDDGEVVRFQDDLGRFTDRPESIVWPRLAVLPQWSKGKVHAEYFEFQSVEPLPEDSLNGLFPSAEEVAGPIGAGFDKAPNYRWAKSIELVSSERPTAEGNADQALGPPDVFPRHEPSSKAWAPSKKSRAWIIAALPTPMRVSGVVVLESYQPGAIVAIDDASNRAQFVPLWRGTVATANQARVNILPFAEPRTIRSIRVVLDPARVAGMPEIDAIGVRLP